MEEIAPTNSLRQGCPPFMLRDIQLKLLLQSQFNWLYSFNSIEQEQDNNTEYKEKYENENRENGPIEMNGNECGYCSCDSVFLREEMRLSGKFPWQFHCDGLPAYEKQANRCEQVA
jgi:hypothetical protein